MVCHPAWCAAESHNRDAHRGGFLLAGLACAGLYSACAAADCEDPQRFARVDERQGRGQLRCGLSDLDVGAEECGENEGSCVLLLLTCLALETKD